MRTNLKILIHKQNIYKVLNLFRLEKIGYGDGHLYSTQCLNKDKNVWAINLSCKDKKDAKHIKKWLKESYIRYDKDIA